MKTESALILFPLCDSRGLLTDILLDNSARQTDVRIENLFFAWLLELPVGVDSAAAARTLLEFADRHMARNKDVEKKSVPTNSAPEPPTARKELQELLLDLVQGGAKNANKEPDNLHSILEDLRRV